MSVSASDLVLYCAANRADDDVSTIGGAIDTAWRPLDQQLTGPASIAVVSDGTDVRTVTIEGRLFATLAVDTEVITLTNDVEAAGTKIWDRILKITLSATSATRTVSVRQNAGGVTRHTVNPNESGAVLPFRKSLANAAATRTYYEKYFWKNNNSTDTLTSATDEETADITGLYAMGLAPSVGDSATAANRLTAPASVTFNSGPQNVPGGGSLGAGQAIGDWFRLSLAINQAAAKDTFENKLAGTG